MASTNIEWTDEAWNPLAGCSKVSQGCKHCYAEKMAKRLRAMGLVKYQDVVDDKGHWTGRIALDEKALLEPLTWKRPRRVFVNSMSDLFHDAVPVEFIDRVFAVMALCPHLTFQVLTKRPDRMADYITNPAADGRVIVAMRAMALPENGRSYPRWPVAWPLPNVWLGTSVEDQPAADTRVPHLLRCAGWVLFLSMEPLLGPVVLREEWLRARSSSHMSISVDGALRNRAFKGWTEGGRPVPAKQVEQNLLLYQAKGVKLLPMGDCPGFDPVKGCPGHPKPRINWVIVGGESGPGARPMHPESARGLRDQCIAAGVAFFLKQWGEWLPEIIHGTAPDLRELRGNQCVRAGDCKSYHIRFTRVGKHAAGRELDGRTWDELPAGMQGEGAAQ